MKEKHPVIQGTIILTLAGFLSRFIGFYNRIFLSRIIGAKELGIYQMIFPVYLLCFSICCQGFEVGLSKMIAAQKAFSCRGNMHFLLKAAMLVCFCLSIFLSIILFIFGDFISIHVFSTPSAGDCLKIIAFALPFVSIKGCIHGYYIGIGNSSVPAICQLAEQTARVGSIICIASSFLYVKFPGAKLAVIGMTIGEIISCLLVLYFAHKEFPERSHTETKKRLLLKDFLKISLPLSGNRISLTLLQSLEAICIPSQMMLYYCDHTLSLELYGVLTGITLPFLFFPSTFTNALATMLLPSVSADYEKKNHIHLNRTISLTTYGCFALGLAFTGIFFLFGPAMGTYIFHSSAAGEYLKILSFLCPALYLSSIFTSILNGMGKTNITFFHNIVSIIVRLLFIFFAIPRFGINGYIWGILISTFVLVFLNYLKIQKETETES